MGAHRAHRSIGMAIHPELDPLQSPLQSGVWRCLGGYSSTEPRRMGSAGYRRVDACHLARVRGGRHRRSSRFRSHRIVARLQSHRARHHQLQRAEAGDGKRSISLEFRGRLRLLPFRSGAFDLSGNPFSLNSGDSACFRSKPPASPLCIARSRGPPASGIGSSVGPARQVLRSRSSLARPHNSRRPARSRLR